jgi:hypothetical protein
MHGHVRPPSSCLRSSSLVHRSWGMPELVHRAVLATDGWRGLGATLAGARECLHGIVAQFKFPVLLVRCVTGKNVSYTTNTWR